MTGPLSVLVVGGGMYVTGRGAPGARGTILPALFEARRAGDVGTIALATTNAESAAQAAQRALVLGRAMGIDGAIDVYPKEGDTTTAYAVAAETMRPDAAIVSVPDHLHAKVCIDLIARGIHCLVVKPLAGTVADGRAMADAAEKANVIAQVEFHKRLDEANLMLRDKVRSGAIGQPLYAVIEYSQRKLIPRDVFRCWVERSNIFQYLGIHYVDLLQWALGYWALRVSAWGQKAYLSGVGVNTWDAMQVVIEWRGPAGESFVSTHITNWIDPDCSSAMSDQKINVVGTHGRYQADQKHRGIQLVSDGAGVEDLNPYFTASWHDAIAGGERFKGYGIASVLQFIGDALAVRRGRASVAELEAHRPSFSTCVMSTAVVEAAQLSLEQGGRPVEVSQ